MEAMEDAFEQFHNQAEFVRRQLRERAASMVAQQRREAGGDSIEIRTGTPVLIANNQRTASQIGLRGPDLKPLVRHIATMKF
jgi:hypothetical protein